MFLVDQEKKHNNSELLFKLIFRRYHFYVIFVIGLLLAAGILDAISIIAILPIISLIGSVEESNNFLSNLVLTFMDGLNITLSIENLLMIILVIFALKSGILLYAMKKVGYARVEIANDQRLRYLRSMLRLNYQNLKSVTLGSISHVIGIEVDRSSRVFLSICQVIAEILTVVIYLLMILLISPYLTGISIFVGVLIVTSLSYFMKFVKKGGRDLTTFSENLAAKATNYIGALKTIRITGSEGFYLAEIEKNTNLVSNAKQNLIFGNQSVKVLGEPVCIIFVVLGIYFSNRFSNIDTPSLIAFSFVFFRIVQKITKLQVTYQSLITDESAYWKVEEKIKNAEQNSEMWFGKKSISQLTNLKFKNVSFRYNGANDFIFKNVNFCIENFGIVALTGVSGSGKSTLLDLLIGLHIPTSGTILVDNVDLQEIDLKDWRNLIGYVGQDFSLIHDTIKNNVKIGRKEFNDDDVRAALIRAEAHGFVERLPNYMDEIVGESGKRFSGGQQQRIALARALIGKPKLLVLDEATSALDLQSEKLVLETVKKLSSEMIVIIVTHSQIARDHAEFIYDMKDCTLTHNKQI